MKRNDLYDYGVLPIHLGAGILCSVLLVAGWAFGLGPLMTESQLSTSIVEEAEDAELQAKQAKDRFDHLASELQAVEDKLDKYAVNLLVADQINPLLAELAQWSELHNLAITRTNASRREALTYYDYVPIQITGEGSYGDFLAMLQRLHRERGDLGVINFGVNRKPTGVGVSFEIELAWYVLSDDMEAKPEPTEAATAIVPVP
ncbi:MAG: type 4a pilus biogenesis protein PilO [Planctomycetota bacterium]